MSEIINKEWIANAKAHFGKIKSGEKYVNGDEKSQQSKKISEDLKNYLKENIKDGELIPNIQGSKWTKQGHYQLKNYIWYPCYLKNFGKDYPVVLNFTINSEGLNIWIDIHEDKLGDKGLREIILKILKEVIEDNIECNENLEWNKDKDTQYGYSELLDFDQHKLEKIIACYKKIIPEINNKIIDLNKDLPFSIEYTGGEKRNIANSQHNENKCIDMQPLNQILYGPPGTGKTYKTINKALEIIENKTREELEQVNRNILNSRFKTYQKNGQIEFVTFHQSYGYEEFVEGIKPCNLEDCGGENDNIKYSVQSGVFKNLAKLASARYEFSENLHNIDFNKYLSVGQEFNTKHGKKFTVQKIDEDIYFEQAGNIHTALRKTILEVLSDEKVMTDDEYYSSQVYIAREIYKQLKREKKSAKNYILIIDEINRGNISKIFGELITLIEPSKRIGEDEALTLTLPYSKDEFGVPSNLYIIGTMNTADRSIAQIDTALRRRFVFEEMMPNADLFTKDKNEITEESQYLERESDLKIQEHDINVRLMLNAINERIEYIHDREHTIGHSYFMELLKEGCNTKEKLDEIFKVSIIPLLAEYFYGDWGDIIEVLNDNNAHFIKNKTLKYKPKTDRKNKVYSINDKFSSKGYINIYNGLPTTEDSDKTK